MGVIDTETKAYLSQPDKVADAFNYWIYGGREVIKPDELQPLDTTAIAIPYGNGNKESIQKFRDVLKLYTAMKDDRAYYLMLGIEIQAKVHYAMPVRNMLYDAMNYAEQVSNLATKHRQDKDKMTQEEFLSGLRKEDRLKPVITLVVSLSAEQWDGARSLHELLAVEDKELLRFVPDYKLNLLTPTQIADEDFANFRTDFGTVMQFVKHQNDKSMDWMSGNNRAEDVDWETASLIKTVTGIDIDIKKGESINMWVAWENGINQAEERGRDVGRSEGITSAREESALAMFADNVPVDKVAQYSKLSLQAATDIGKKHGYLQ